MGDLSYILNEIFAKVRTELGYTQYEMALNLNCSQELISKIENKNRDMSYDLMFSLAAISKMDFHYYRYIASKFLNKEDYDIYLELAKMTDTDYIGGFEGLEELLNSTNAKEKLTYGEPRALVIYCEALVQFYKYKDYEKVVEICLDGGLWEESKLGTYKITTLKAGYYYGVFALLVRGELELGNLEIGLKLCENFFLHVEDVWQTEYYELAITNYLYRKFYLEIYCVYISLCLESGDFNKVIELCDMLLEKCKDLNVLHTVKFIMRWKVEALCKKNENKAAKDLYNELKIICKYSDTKNQFNEVLEQLVEKYPEHLK